MAELRPLPFAILVERLFRELDRDGTVFDLPARAFYRGPEDLDLSATFHGSRAATPFGPAAGPQSQMAQNLVLSWLAGGRIMELKTVQINDELVIPRPCIDMQTVGYNVEWSQELTLPASLEEYVKGAMLVRMLEASGVVPIVPGFGETIWDMSVGYDLAGIKSEKVQAFLDGMADATPVIDRLRDQIPPEWAHLRDLDYPRRLSHTLTLSTFHGCPPQEIESIIDFLLRERELDCIVKLNPTLLGQAEVAALLRDALGYVDIRVPARAFEQDTTWDQALDFVGRLSGTARERGLGFGVKLTNTLIVENHRDFFPATERDMYLSGRPLHVLAMHLVRRFRRTFGAALPLSFSAGIERANFADSIACGLVPVTVCSDLLRAGGYARGRGYFDELEKRMRALGAGDLAELAILGHGHAAVAGDDVAQDADERDGIRAALASGRLRKDVDPALFARWHGAALVRNAETYAERLVTDPRYHASQNAKGPRKIGRHLRLFDCVTCDKCVPVCPNDANFALPIAAGTVVCQSVVRVGESWEVRDQGSLRLEERHQLANVADLCNECGNCDVFCPEDGGPYVIKPRFFLTLDDWRTYTHLDGFHLEPLGTGYRIHGRVAGRASALEVDGDATRYRADGFLVTRRRERVVAVEAPGRESVDLTDAAILRLVLDAILDGDGINWVNAGLVPSGSKP